MNYIKENDDMMMLIMMKPIYEEREKEKKRKNAQAFHQKRNTLCSCSMNPVSYAMENPDLPPEKKREEEKNTSQMQSNIRCTSFDEPPFFKTWRPSWRDSIVVMNEKKQQRQQQR
jgi:hypothetical protein